MASVPAGPAEGRVRGRQRNWPPGHGERQHCCGYREGGVIGDGGAAGGPEQGGH